MIDIVVSILNIIKDVLSLKINIVFVHEVKIYL